MVLSLFAESTAHWSIFVFDEGNTDSGTLFHVKKESYYSGWTIQYEQRRYSIRHSKSANKIIRRRYIDLEVTVAALDQACQRVSKNRSFNIISKNCHDWVQEVVDELTRAMGLKYIALTTKLK